MALNKAEIRDSGLLELYVLGELSADDRRVVLDAIVEYPELKQDISEIERAFYAVAKASAAKAPRVPLENALQYIRTDKGSTSPKPRENVGLSRGWLMMLPILACAAVLWWVTNGHNTEKQELQASLVDCEAKSQSINGQLMVYQALNDQDNIILAVAATEKYPETKLYFHTNDTSKKNYIQIQNLPPINDNQSYQLWSLKPDTDPIPLDVFQGDESAIIEVSYEEATANYAITIEPRGGQQSPTLANLIGLFTI